MKTFGMIFPCDDWGEREDEGEDEVIQRVFMARCVLSVENAARGPRRDVADCPPKGALRHERISTDAVDCDFWEIALVCKMQPGPNSSSCQEVGRLAEGMTKTAPSK